MIVAASLAQWSAFFMMAAGAAATLTGLMFVAVTLITGREQRTEELHEGVSTFSTPTVVHFGAAFLVSAVLSMPWASLRGPFIVLMLGGLAGAIHMARVFHRTRRITTYDPDFEDWVWYTIVPFLVYVTLFIGAAVLPFATAGALFVLAGAVLALIFVGIHNAWDVVTFIAIYRPPGSRT
jgi:hypothetical protein